uniref:Uncharacterized protein n=1 Tax=viral metagenome TaxID=1070528 RepID=A0A6C0EHF3_9ZZZZ
MNSIVNITSVLSVMISISFMIFLYVRYLNNQNAKNPFLQNETKKIEYPQCPDFFESTTDNNDDKVCKNVYKIGKCRLSDPYTASFLKDDLFTNTKDGNYWKCRWAKECEVPWEGIDNLC